MTDPIASFSDDQLERYARHIILKDLGGVGQARLLAARVLIIGLGGLGAPVVQYLAAGGVGALVLVDGDDVELSNLQRQTLYATADIGTPKAESAARVARAINPEIAVDIHTTHAAADTIDALVADADVVIDGTDQFTTRLMVSDAAVRAGKPLVSGALGPTEGQLAVFDPAFGDDQPCYRCFLPEAPGEDHQRTCNDAGVVGALAGVMGTLMALEATKLIADMGAPLRGKMLVFDALDARQRVLRIQRNPGCAACGGGAR